MTTWDSYKSRDIPGRLEAARAGLNPTVIGNSDPFLHAHLIPRHADEPTVQLRRPIWEVARTLWDLPEYQFDLNKHGALQSALRARLVELNAFSA